MGEAGEMGGAMPEGARPRGTSAGAGLETERPMPPNEP
jgi:hypothetical protein